jgi:hypothetical protein
MINKNSTPFRASFDYAGRPAAGLVIPATLQEGTELALVVAILDRRYVADHLPQRQQIDAGTIQDRRELTERPY